jgi:large exoprotein involved in heme utilization and adhesion
MRNNSQISAIAGKTGNGGNITINSPLFVIALSENSDIIANALKDRGG